MWTLIFLPEPDKECVRDADSLLMLHASGMRRNMRLSRSHGDSQRNIPRRPPLFLVRTNAELAEVHRLLEEAGLPHIAVGVRDCFRQVPFKALMAHMAVALKSIEVCRLGEDALSDRLRATYGRR